MNLTTDVIVLVAAVDAGEDCLPQLADALSGTGPGPVTLTVDLVHTASGDHALTAFGPDGEPVASLAGGEVVAPGLGGERLETLAECRPGDDVGALLRSLEHHLPQ